MVELDPEFCPNISELETEVTKHFEDGASRAEDVITGWRKSPSMFRPPTELLPKNAEEWSQDWTHRHLQAYVLDSIASTVSVGPATQDKLSSQTLENLASSVGSPDYFHAYCTSRMLDPKRVLNLAHNYLDSSAATFRQQSESFLGSKFGTFHEDLIQDRLTSAVTHRASDYPHERTVHQVDKVIHELGLKALVDNSRESTINLTVNVPHPESRTSSLFLARSRGIEAYRGALHALGHSVFSVVAPRIEDDLGVNIAATETIAFQAQHIALDGAPSDSAEFLRFLHLYQSRLYAVRTIHESIRLENRSPELEPLQDLGREHLGLAKIRPHQFRPKLVAVDFLIAFSEYFRQGEIPPDWSEILNLAQKTSNTSITNNILLKTDQGR